VSPLPVLQLTGPLRTDLYLELLMIEGGLVIEKALLKARLQSLEDRRSCA
jgi:hypothetical protein